jgi:hypothetical protein
MKKYFYLFLCLPVFLLAQNEKKTKQSLFKINILNPGFTFEKGLSDQTTLCLDANLSFGFAIHNNQTTFLASPFLRGQYRYYYNLEKRISKGKNISNNSGGFIALHTSYYLKPLGNDLYVSSLDRFTFGGIWGFQKTYESGFSLGVNAGLGYNLSNQQSPKVLPILNFTVGWIIGK